MNDHYEPRMVESSCPFCNHQKARLIPMNFLGTITDKIRKNPEGTTVYVDYYRCLKCGKYWKDEKK